MMREIVKKVRISLRLGDKISLLPNLHEGEKKPGKGGKKLLMRTEP